MTNPDFQQGFLLGISGGGSTGNILTSLLGNTPPARAALDSAAGNAVGSAVTPVSTAAQGIVASGPAGANLTAPQQGGGGY